MSLLELHIYIFSDMEISFYLFVLVGVSCCINAHDDISSGKGDGFSGSLMNCGSQEEI